MNTRGRISKKADTRLTKGLIIFIAFPGLAYAFYGLCGFFLIAITGLLGGVLDIKLLENKAIAYSVTTLSLLVGCLLSYLTCKTIWPKKAAIVDEAGDQA